MVVALQYVNKETKIHQLDSRIKLISLVLLLGGFSQLNSIVSYSLAALIIFIIVHIGQLSLTNVWQAVRPMTFILLFTFGYHVLLSGDSYFSIEGALIGGQYVIRILLMVVLAVVLTFTTSPLALALGLERLLLPFQKIGLPVGKISLMFTIALRFLPLIVEEWQRIQVSQKARGIIATTFRERITLTIKTLVPLLLSLVTRADQITLAIEARAFGNGTDRTHYHVLTIKPVEYVYVGLSLLLMVVLWGVA